MKKSVRLTLNGSLQPMFFLPYVKDEATKLNVRGFVRELEDKRVEVFMEGDTTAVEAMIPKCKTGPYNTKIRDVEMRDERFQDFKDFRIMKI
ncbi:MAG TPA: acylphosphatase [Candidatus Nanoarchaeia archaeon]|nr:acylphosphatase [Candidatus Nanoarchaeia archaeon]